MRKLLFVVLFLCGITFPALLYAQLNITGTVTDANKSPVSGASVRVMRSTMGASTDASGKFTLRLPGKNAVLEISAIGFQSATVNVSESSSVIDISLKEDVGKLDEVVVTGLATTIKRRNLANAVATVSSKELTGVAPAQTLDAALNGKIPGAYINANSGAPGGGITVKLRGVTSVYGNTQPLYVVDGVFIDNTATPSGANFITGAATSGSPTNQDNPSNRMADIRPEDIENIEILKGASAAAIYGSKAAAGVVIITTKKGRPGQTQVNVSQGVGFAKVRKLLGSRVFTADRAADLGGSASSTDPNVQAARAAIRQEFLDAQRAGKIYDYEKELYGHTGFLRNSSLSITGGGDKTSFYFSAAQKSEDGIIERTGYRNSSIRLNLDHHVTSNIKVGVTTNYINSSADRALTQNDNAGVTLGVALASTPNFTELHPDARGNYPANKYAASNPLQTRDLVTNNEEINRFITGINLDAILQQSAKSTTRLIARGGIDFYNLKTTALFPSSLQFQAVNKGTSIQGATKNLNSNYIVSLVNNFKPSDKLSLTTSAGYTQENSDYDNLLDIATQVIAGQSNVDQAGALTATQFRLKYQDVGMFIQEEASIIDAITVTGGVRFDKSTKNGDPNKYYVFPKAGLSWNLTRSGIMKSGFFDNLKLRAAYGQSSNFPVYGSKFTDFLISNINGTPGSLINNQRGQPGIKPERQTELEAGIDMSMLKGRLNIEATFYNKKIYDFLMQNSLAASSGFTIGWVNAGDLRNSGIEIGINAQPVSSRNISWTSSVNFWFNRSKITKLSIPPVVLGGFGNTLGTFKIEQGRSATQIVGIDTSSAGVIKLGDAEPKFQMNFFNEITFFKNLSLRFLIHWKQGGNNINLSQLLTDLGGTSPDYDDVESNGKIAGQNRAAAVGATARPFVQPAGFVRLREIGLYYRFPVTPFSFIKGLRVGVSANNFITITKYKGYDPEVSNFGTGFSTGVDVMPYPASKRASFHISVDL